MHAIVAVSVVIKPLYFSGQPQIVVNDIKASGPDVQFQAGGSDWIQLSKKFLTQMGQTHNSAAHLFSLKAFDLCLLETFTDSQTKYLPTSGHASPLPPRHPPAQLL